ncbi:hypothetical protein Ga0123461_1624 [Mariprofundus aestuarium]|uniref:Uncharacterized protein n=1 Tax=Mariprofundus aestuarium TaxID=1921086 RepID=A0A2K8KYJ0_MARES|nr:hypothetical protein [Mariprofundus aestuarium]ATX80037.1 hypothetical protein Ga0123461_1624 [Mariprofundus aestuarium]
MGHHAFDYSIWEKGETPKQEKLKHSQRFELKQQQKKKRDYDEWDEWED